MTLFECKCGAFFTAALKKTTEHRWYICQNCGEKFQYLAGETGYETDERLSASAFKVMTIPEGVSIKVSYTL